MFGYLRKLSGDGCTFNRRIRRAAVTGRTIGTEIIPGSAADWPHTRHEPVAKDCIYVREKQAYGSSLRRYQDRFNTRSNTRGV